MLAKAKNPHKLGVVDSANQLPDVSPLLLEPIKDVQLDQKVLDAIGVVGAVDEGADDDDALYLTDSASAPGDDA